MRNAGGNPSRKPRAGSAGGSVSLKELNESEEPEDTRWLRSDTHEPQMSGWLSNDTSCRNVTEVDCLQLVVSDREKKIFCRSNDQQPHPQRVAGTRGISLNAQSVSVVPAGTSTCCRPSSMYVIGEVPCSADPI